MDRTKKDAILVLVLALTVFGTAHVVRRGLCSEHGSASRVPDLVGSWRSTDAGADLDFLKSSLGAQDIVFRNYYSGMDMVNLYIAYYKDVDSANRVHAPAVCYPGQGWKIVVDETVTRVMCGKKVRINRIVIQKEDRKEMVYNWWQTGDKTIAANSVNRFYQMFRSITGRDPSTLWVRLSIALKNDEDKQEELALKFCNDLKPLLVNSTPVH